MSRYFISNKFFELKVKVKAKAKAIEINFY
jgi:hypothetical protein